MATTKTAASKRPYVRSETLTEVGISGLKRFSGFVQEEFVRDLTGRKGMRVYREMKDNSAMVGACLGAIEGICRQVSWHVKPVSDDSADVAAAAFVESCLHDMSSTWTDTLSEILTMLPFGFAFHELVYKKRAGDSNDGARRSKYTDGLIGWRKLPGRSQETVFNWDFDPEGGVQAMNQLAPPDYSMRKIPIEKALLFRAKTEKGNPEGRSVLRNAYFSYYCAKQISIAEGIGIERDLNGLPVVWIPYECMLPTATAEQKQTYEDYKNMVRNIRRDEQDGMVMPMAFDTKWGHKLYDVTLLNSSGRRFFDTLAIRSAYERAMAATMLQDLVFMGSPNTLLYKGTNTPQMFAVGLEGWLDSIADVLNDHAIPRLLRLNAMPVESSPKVFHGEVQATNLGLLGTFLLQAFQSGMPLFPDEALEADIRRKAGLPQKGDQAAVGPEGGNTGLPGPDDPDLEPGGAGAGSSSTEPEVVATAVTPFPTQTILPPTTTGKGIRLSDLAKQLGCSKEYLRKLISSGSLPASRVGREFRVRLEDAQAVLE